MSADANANGIFSFSSFQTVACRQRDPWWSCYCLCLAFDVSKTKSLQQCYQCAYVHTFQVFDIGSFFREAKTRIGMWTRLRNFQLSCFGFKSKPKMNFRILTFNFCYVLLYSMMYCWTSGWFQFLIKCSKKDFVTDMKSLIFILCLKNWWQKIELIRLNFVLLT